MANPFHPERPAPDTLAADIASAIVVALALITFALVLPW